MKQIYQKCFFGQYLYVWKYSDFIFCKMDVYDDDLCRYRLDCTGFSEKNWYYIISIEDHSLLSWILTKLFDCFPFESL